MLFRSSSEIINSKLSLNRYTKILIVLFLVIIFWLLISSLLNQRNFFPLLFGTYKRYVGLSSFLLLALAMLYVSQQSDSVRKYFVKSIRLTYLIFAIYCLMQFLKIDPINWQALYKGSFGTLGNPNFASGLLGVLLPIFIHGFKRRSTKLTCIFSIF